MLTAPAQQQAFVAENFGLLIVENDPTDRSLLQQWFENQYRLTFAQTTADALILLREQLVDLVLIDLNTLESLDLLREIRGTLDLPVILISELGDSGVTVQGLQLGANDYVTKPFDAEVVRARVSTQFALKHAEDERKQTLTQLEFTHEMQENFTRIVSHDLKGPLTNIRMAQFMLRDILNDNDEARNILDNIDMTLNGMIEMIHVFLNAMESQQLEAETKPMEVHDLIFEIMEQHRLAAERKQIRLVMRDTERRVIADERLLRQVLNNLVSNAVKFSLPNTETCIWTEAHDDIVRICIADGGPGIPPLERSKLFTMFSKLSTRPTGGETSTGLGLWIVRELTNLQGGQVGYDPAPGGGSLFWVELAGA